MIKISIVVPVYNVEKYLVRCLESVISQLNNSTEVILVDDGSTDGSAIICDKYSERDKVIHVVHQKNQGLSAARNIGIDKSIGDYIMFLDSDDWIEEGTIDYFCNIIDKYSPDIISGKAIVVDDLGRCSPKIQYFIPEGLYKIEEYLGFLKERMVYTPCAPFSIYRRDFLNENGLRFKVGILHEDTLWTPTVLISACDIYCADMFFYYNYVRIGSITHSGNEKRRGADLITVCNELRKLFSEYGDKGNFEVLKDIMVRKYLEATVMLGVPIKGERKFTKQELIRNSYFGRTQKKAILYFFSPCLYILIAKIFLRVNINEIC